MEQVWVWILWEPADGTSTTTIAASKPSQSFVESAFTIKYPLRPYAILYGREIGTPMQRSDGQRKAVCLAKILRFLIVKVRVGAFNKEKEKASWGLLWAL